MHPCDCESLACLHAAACEEPWSAAAIADLMAQDGVFAVVAFDPPGDSAGFVLMRVAADEAEILTLAVRPASRQRGLGRAMIREGAKKAVQMGGKSLFLEVNVGNFAARNLYAGLGFLQVGMRRGYYHKDMDHKEDALVLSVGLPLLDA
jgi:[ribosomal protein S18]-alanine N-acetyltransferase